MKFICVPQNACAYNKFYGFFATVAYIIFVAYSVISDAVWFDGTSSPEVIEYKMKTLNQAFEELTQGSRPLAKGITSEKVWHDWEAPNPLTEQQYVEIAKFYQFENSPTLLTKSFLKSKSKDNPENSFDLLSYVFFDEDDKSKYIKEFENKLIGGGNLNTKNHPTAFDAVNSAAKYTEQHYDGSKLKYAIRELRKAIETLQFDYVLKYAIAQSNIDSVKNILIKDSDKSISRYSLVEHMNFHANKDYTFLENKEILLAVMNLLKQNAKDNEGLLKDLKQIDSLDSLLASNKYITCLQTILNNLNNNEKDPKSHTPILNNYFSHKKINEKNYIAGRLLPFRDTLCTNNSYFLSGILHNLITSITAKQNLYTHKNTQRSLTWYKGSRLTASFSKNLGNSNFKYLAKNKLDSNILMAGIENNFNKNYVIGMLYSYIDSKIIQKLETNEINNKLAINSNFIAVYGNILEKDYRLKFYTSYNINNGNSMRIDSQNNNYHLNDECHSVSIFAEASVKMETYHKLFIEPSLILKSYIHLEHSYEEYSDNVTHKLMPLSIVAKSYQNIDLGAKLALYSRSKGDNDEIITTLWLSVLQDIMRHNPEYLIGINDSKVLFRDYSHAKRKYELGLTVSWIKNKLSANFDIWSRSSNKENISCVGLEINYKL